MPLLRPGRKREREGKNRSPCLLSFTPSVPVISPQRSSSRVISFGFVFVDDETHGAFFPPEFSFVFILVCISYFVRMEMLGYPVVCPSVFPFTMENAKISRSNPRSLSRFASFIRSGASGAPVFRPVGYSSVARCVPCFVAFLVFSSFVAWLSTPHRRRNAWHPPPVSALRRCPQ